MTLAPQPERKVQKVNRFADLEWIVRPDQEFLVTGYTHRQAYEVMPGTVDWREGGWRIVPDEDISEGFYSGITGSPVRYIPFIIERTSSVNLDEGMVHLSIAAETGKEDIFVQILERIDWRTRSAEHYVQAIQLALSIGAHLSAHQLVSDGFRKFPSHKVLSKIAYILLPPKAVQVHRQSDSSIGMNKDWFEKHSSEYRGRWVALKNGHLLGSAQSFLELKQSVLNWHEVTIAKITW